MAGNKNSGRKSRYSEIRVHELGSLSVEWAIKNFDTLSSEDKLKIVLVLAPKFVTQKHEGEFTINFAEEVKKARERVAAYFN